MGRGEWREGSGSRGREGVDGVRDRRGGEGREEQVREV